MINILLILFSMTARQPALCWPASGFNKHLESTTMDIHEQRFFFFTAAEAATAAVITAATGRWCGGGCSDANPSQIIDLSIMITMKY